MRYILEHTCKNAVERMVRSSPHLRQAPSESFWSGFNREVEAGLVEAFAGDVDIACVDFEDLEAELEKMFHGHTQPVGSTVITTDRDLSHWHDYQCLEVNRLIAPGGLRVVVGSRVSADLFSEHGGFGEIVGIGPRPGAHNLDKQLASIKETANGGPAMIIEDGAFSGETLACVLDRFAMAEVHVDTVYIGFLFEKANEKLSGRDVDIHYWQGPTELDGSDEWVLDQDFFPFLPGAGRVVGYQLHGTVRPVYSLGGFHLSRPYIFPYGNVVEWASIPEQSAVVFSRKMVGLSIDLFHEIERVNGGMELQCRHLGQTYPRTGLPVSVLDNGFPNPEDRVVGVLNDCFRRLSTIPDCLHAV